MNLSSDKLRQGLKWIQATCVMPRRRMNGKPARAPKLFELRFFAVVYF